MEATVSQMWSEKEPVRLRLPRLEEALIALRQSASVRPYHPPQHLPSLIGTRRSPNRSANQSAKSSVLELVKHTKGCHNATLLRTGLRSPAKLQIVRTEMTPSKEKKSKTRSKSDGKMEASFVLLDVSKKQKLARHIHRTEHRKLPLQHLLPRQSPVSPSKVYTSRTQTAKFHLIKRVRNHIMPSKTAKPSPTRRQEAVDWSSVGVGPWEEGGDI